MLGWLLRGRTYLHPKEFRNRNHHHVFFHTLSVLNLLRPLVFELATVSCVGGSRFSRYNRVHLDVGVASGILGHNCVHGGLRVYMGVVSGCAWVWSQGVHGCGLRHTGPQLCAWVWSQAYWATIVYMDVVSGCAWVWSQGVHGCGPLKHSANGKKFCMLNYLINVSK